MSRLFSAIRTRFFDANGEPLAGGKLFTYEAFDGIGSPVPKATYTTPALTVPNANPVILDASGEADVHGQGDYYFVLKDSLDVVQASKNLVDDVASDGTITRLITATDNNGDDMVAHVDTVTTTYLKTVSDVLNGTPVSVLRFIDPAKAAGIKARTNTDDLSAQINTATQALSAAGGGELLLPRGLLHTASSLTLYSAVSIRGEGSAATEIKLKDSSNVDIFKTPSFDTLTGTGVWLVSAGVQHGIGLHGLRLNGNKANNASGRGVSAYAKRSQITDFMILDCAGIGFWGEAGNIAGQTDYKDLPEGHVSMWVRNCGSHGVIWRGGHDQLLKQINVALCGGDGVRIESDTAYSGGGESDLIHSYANAGWGIILNGPAVRAKTWISESNTKGGIVLQNCGRPQILQMQCYLNAQGSATPAYWDLDIQADCIDAMIGQVRGACSEIMNGGVNILGSGTQIDQIMMAASGAGATGTGVFVDADFVRILSMKVNGFDGVGGRGLRTNGTAARKGCTITGMVLSDNTTCWDNGSGGTANVYSGHLLANAGQTAFTGSQPAANKSEEWEVTATTSTGTKVSRDIVSMGTVDLTLTTEQSFTVAHDLLTTPRIDDVTLTLDGSTAQTAWAVAYMKTHSVDATNIVAKVRLATAAAGGTVNLRAVVKL